MKDPVKRMSGLDVNRSDLAAPCIDGYEELFFYLSQVTDTRIGFRIPTLNNKKNKNNKITTMLAE